MSCLREQAEFDRTMQPLDYESDALPLDQSDPTNALVSSRLDYCNLSSTADTDLTKLRCVQNRLTCVLWWIHSSVTHNVPLLRSLYWLPVKFRVDFCMLQNSFWKTTSYLHSILALSLIPFTEMEQRNHSVGPYGQDQRRRKDIPLLCLFLSVTASHCLSIQPPQL